MGSTFQTIADLDAPPQDAPRLAERVIEWLVAEGIVLAEAQPGWALGEDPAHPPGPHWHKAVPDGRRGAPEGLAVHTERTVFHGGQGGRMAARCPRCATTTRFYTDDRQLIHETWAPFIQAIGTWHETGAAEVCCPSCAESVSLPAWTWTDDHFAFARLGFQFWNWPEFSEEFRARISELVDGHRTAYVRGKI